MTFATPGLPAPPLVGCAVAAVIHCAGLKAVGESVTRPLAYYKANVGGGVKAILPRGDIYTEIGAAYLHETRFQSGQSAGGVSVFTNFSFNWNLLGRKAGR